MGKLILCNGKEALEPYCFKITNTNVFSIEELCYYVYQNVTTLTQELREERLIGWMEDQLGLIETAQKLRQLIASEAGYKDIVVCILLSCDYYGEDQIKELLFTLDEFIHLPPVELSVKRAYNYLKYKQYAKALAEFEELIEDTEFATLTDDIKGRIFYNMGVALLHSKGPQGALNTFLEAYHMNGNQDALKTYFFILFMTKQEDRAIAEANTYQLSNDDIYEWKQEYIKSLEGLQDISRFKNTIELREAKESGKVARFYQVTSVLIEDIKKSYREENV